MKTEAEILGEIERLLDCTEGLSHNERPEIMTIAYVSRILALRWVLKA